MGQRNASKATINTTGRLLARTLHICSVVSGRSPRGKHSPASTLRTRGVRFNPKIVVHVIPPVDQMTKSKMYYSRKEIAGFESLQKMEEVISMFALKRLGMPSCSDQLPSDVDAKIKHRRGKRSRVSSENTDCTMSAEQSLLTCSRLEIWRCVAVHKFYNSQYFDACLHSTTTREDTSSNDEPHLRFTIEYCRRELCMLIQPSTRRSLIIATTKPFKT